MKIIINLFFLIVLLHIFFAGCSETSEDELDNAVVTADTAIVTADNISTTTALIIEEVTAVTTPNIDTTPNYTFSSSKAGTITYGGSCSSSTTIAISGINNITFNVLTDGTYDDCTITVTENSGN
jgi:Flp pilus assembly protein TadG